MASRRLYYDGCAAAHGLDLVGERWALLVVRELLLGPKRFTDLRAGLPHVSPDVLSQRLRELEQAGVLRRHRLPPPAASHVYELTPRGHELEPIVLGLGRWGSQAAFGDEGEAFGPDSAMLALKTLFDSSRAGDLDAGYEFRLGEQRFRLAIRGGALALARGAAPKPDIVIETDPATLAAVLWHGRDVDAALAAGTLVLDGPRPLLDALLRALPLPGRAAAA
jgi:DNA-binding HxlR family transcriptional regulator